MSVARRKQMTDAMYRSLIVAKSPVVHWILRLNPHTWAQGIGVLAAAVLLVACGGGAIEGPDANVEVSEEEDRGGDSVYENVNLTETNDEGRVLWVVNAATAQYGDGGRVANLFDVDGSFFDEDGNEVKIFSQTGLVIPGEQRLELEGEVEANADYLNLELDSERAVWLPEENFITAIGDVVLTETEAGVVVIGDRLEGDLATRYFTLRNDTEELLEAEGTEPPLDLVMKELDWDLANRVVIARGDVEIYHRERAIRMEGAELTFEIPTDLLTMTGEVYAKSEEDGAQLWAAQVNWVVGTDITTATGGVRYSQPDQDLTVVGERGQANWAENTVTVSGGSTLTQLTLPD